MDVLYLLIPLSVLAMFGVLAVFAWALHGGQFDDVEIEGERVLLDADVAGLNDPTDASIPSDATDTQPWCWAAIDAAGAEGPRRGPPLDPGQAGRAGALEQSSP